MYVYVYIYIYVCVYVYIYIYIAESESIYSFSLLIRRWVFWVEEAWKGMCVLSLNDFCYLSCGLDQKLLVTDLEGIL